MMCERYDVGNMLLRSSEGKPCRKKWVRVTEGKIIALLNSTPPIPLQRLLGFFYEDADATCMGFF